LAGSGIDFDRNDIEMNKMVITTLESKFRLYDLYTFRLRAYNGFGRSVPRQIDLMTCPGSPEPPQLLSSTTNSLRINWKSSSSKTGKDLKYAVEKQEIKGGKKIWKVVWCGH